LKLKTLSGGRKWKGAMGSTAHQRAKRRSNRGVKWRRRGGEKLGKTLSGQIGGEKMTLNLKKTLRLNSSVEGNYGLWIWENI